MITFDEILAQVNDIFKDVLDSDDVSVNSDSTAEDVAEWDSLSHIQLVVAIEKHFRVRFTSSEINNFRNVGEMCEGILRKMS